MHISQQIERFKQYYSAGYSQADNVIRCFAKSEKDRKIKIAKAMTYITSLGLSLKIERSISDSSFIVKPLFN